VFATRLSVRFRPAPPAFCSVFSVKENQHFKRNGAKLCARFGIVVHFDLLSGAVKKNQHAKRSRL